MKEIILFYLHKALVIQYSNLIVMHIHTFLQVYKLVVHPTITLGGGGSGDLPILGEDRYLQVIHSAA